MDECPPVCYDMSEGGDRMRDMPFFTTDHGVASLTLKEIPYKNAAYIRIQAAESPEKLLAECVSFCRACGAEHIYATGHSIAEQYPLHTKIWEMTCPKEQLPDTDAALFPVQENTLSQWREHYNIRMATVPNAATMTIQDSQKLLEEGSAYFIHKGDTLLGIGKASGDRIDAVAALIPGSGRELVAALSHAISEEIIRVEVASANLPAIRLYEAMGFIKTAENAVWYRVFPE